MSCPVIATRNGKVSGLVSRSECKNVKPVYVYRGIPFAKPPLGSLRFMPPEPAEPWEGVRDGTQEGKLPPQMIDFQKPMMKFVPMKPATTQDVEIGEDCLHLTVFTPEPTKAKNLPVMVWLYGGGFQMGDARLYDPTALAGLNDVIVVIPNYRLNVFGFLSMGMSSVCSGNAGLLDQQLALKWVQDNIDAFGGDNSNVTLFGESAGAISVHMQMLSPLACGLFHKGISHSGQANMPGMLESEQKMKKVLARFTKELGIEENDEMKLLESLQKASVDDLLKNQTKLMMEDMSFRPVVDGKVLTKTPEQSLKDKDFAKMPYIIGCNDSEWHGLLSLLLSPNFMKGMTEEAADKTLILLPLREATKATAKKFYLKEEYGETRFSRMFGDMLGDATFIAPAANWAHAHTDAGVDVYKYIGAFQLRMHHDDEYGKEVGKKPEWCHCDHGDDVFMTFGLPFHPKHTVPGAKFSDDETALSRKWMTYLANFAKTGNPNKGAKVEVEWPKHTSQGEYLKLANPITTGRNFRRKSVEFWTKTVPEMEKL